ncbi:PqqD family peptide modification chaperone [Microbacterium sp. NPDC089190]|uniref:PqqD family peptide modification chaperone n=1 Tax=Microbacterium sp. NPDC089190 TaxID=3155063 RepID=UPI00344B504D
MSPADDGSAPATVCTVDAMGVVVDMRTDAPLPDRMRSRILEAWRDCRVGAEDTRGRRVLELHPDAFVDPDGGLSNLSTLVTLEALDALRGTRLLLHAAGVATEDGRTIALVGPSGRGKTTASRHLGRHFSYVSDETVAVADDLAVSPYRKPLSVITEGLVHKEQIAPSHFGLKGLPAVPLRLVGLTLIDRRPGSPTVGPEVVDLIDAVCEMTPQISYLPEMPAPLQRLARLFDTIGAPTRLIYRDATELPALVQQMFDAPPPRAQAWTLPRRTDSVGPWRATAYDDAILVDGRACILRDGVVTALEQLGRLVWTLCLAGASEETIAEAAEAEFGEPAEGSASAVIRSTLDELRTRGFIEAA